MKKAYVCALGVNKSRQHRRGAEREATVVVMSCSLLAGQPV